MWWVRRAVVWLALGVALTAALNFLLVARAPHTAPARHHKTSPRPQNSLPHKAFLQGEVYAIRDSDYHKQNQRNRTGLAKAVQSLYSQLAYVRAQHSSPSPHVHSLVHALKEDLTRRRTTSHPWELPKKWATPRSLVPVAARGLGDVLGALTGAPITASNVGYKGTQLKVDLVLKGGQRAVFKPRWYSREEVIEGEVYAGADRHNGEVAAFHLSRLLALPMVPLTVGRRVSLRKHLLPVASQELAATFFKRRGGKMCFYGVCYYCHKDFSVCDNGHTLEGAVSLWLPRHLPLTHLPHPWARTYTPTHLASWEERPHFCEEVRQHPPYTHKSPRLLDLMDTAVFDFLIQNGDRHHYTVVAGKPESSVVLLDNGKSFGDAEVDHLDILAPLLQCCRLRQTTYERLVLLVGGGLSWGLQELLAQDPISPVLTQAHLLALDRRLLHILATLTACRELKGGWHNVLY